MQVDNVYFFQPLDEAKVDCAISLLNLPEIANIPKGSLCKLFEVERLFASTEPTSTQPQASGSVDAKQLEKLIERRSGEFPTQEKRQKKDERVDLWFKSFHKEGLLGNVGLVPEPLSGKYPKNAPNKLDSDVRAFVVHFDRWLKKREREEEEEEN